MQPIIAYQLGRGWSVSAGDAQFIYDWEDDRWLSIPLGFQVGKVAKWGNQPMRVSLNQQEKFADDDFLPEWSVKLTVTMLVPSG